MTLVEGQRGEDEGAVVLLRFHHTLTDGLGAVALAEQIFEPSRRPAPRLPADRPSHRGAPRHLRAGWGASPLYSCEAAGIPLPPLAPGPGGRKERRLAWLNRDLEEVRSVAHAHEATTKDLVLAAVAHGLRTLLLERGEVVATRDELKVLVPVSPRPDDQRGTLGNQVGVLIVPLPIGIGDPLGRLRAISQTTARLKRSREAASTRLLLSAADALPAPLIGPLAHLTDRQRLVNIVVTNVPGPPIPLYCRGARMIDADPVVPLGGNLTIGVAVLSYDGSLNVGLTADATSVGDLASSERASTPASPP